MKVGHFLFYCWAECSRARQLVVLITRNELPLVRSAISMGKARQSTILPILDFGDVIYKIASNTLLSKLDAVYHSAIRFVTKAVTVRE